jgi:predicted RNase H-like nuclease
MSAVAHVGVDGCPAGWIAVSRIGDGEPRIAIHAGFAELLAASGNAIIAIDMPIGLPDFIRHSGRGPEQAVRPLLGARQSSVFSIPSRRAVHCEDYREGCAVALATSDPPRKISRQAFFLFGKIRQIDAALTPQLQLRVRETHPELAFWRMNGGQALTSAKKIKGRLNPEGFAERCALLERHGFSGQFLRQRPPRGAASDDLLDACACTVIAGRIAVGLAEPFPRKRLVDSKGLHIAIWA